MTVSEGERVRRLLFDTVAVSVLRKVVAVLCLVVGTALVLRELGGFQ